MPRARDAGSAFNYERAREILTEAFRQAEEDFRAQTPTNVSPEIAAAADILFRSRTQSYREVLIGVVLVRLLDPARNLRKPYSDQGDGSYSGRTMDENVVNPFLHEQTVPSSRGPYLATFRRSVQFVRDLPGQRDREGYDAFLAIVEALGTATEAEAKAILRRLLYGFVAIRDAAHITLSQVHRLSLEQHEALIDGLLRTPSRGLLPVLLTVAMFHTLREVYGIPWDVLVQGINVADTASGAGGDITVKRNGRVVLTVEVTERPIDRPRVVATFNAKISPHGLDDYLFFTTGALPTEDAKAAARQYFASGHEISFLQVKPWLVNCLGTIGPKGRATYTEQLLKILAGETVPASAKIAWNEQVRALFG